MRDLIRTFVQNGGMNLGINLVDAETLKKAKAEPEQYRSLTVRLFGYSDYFNNLSETLKEALIQKAGQPESLEVWLSGNKEILDER